MRFRLFVCMRLEALAAVGQTDTSERKGVLRAVLAHPSEIPEKHVRFISNKKKQALSDCDLA